MQRVELFQESRGPVAVSFAPIINTQQGGEKVGTSIKLETVPLMDIAVFPHLVIFRRGENRSKLEGQAQFRWGGKKLMVDARSENEQLLIDHSGKTVWIRDPQTQIKGQEIDLFTGKPIKRTRGHIDFKKIFAGVTITDESTFDSLTFGQIIRFFREEDDLTLEQYATRANLTTMMVSNLENGKSLVSQNPFLTFVEGFGWIMDDLRTGLMKRSFDRAKKQQSDKNKANAPKGSANHWRNRS